MQLAAYCYSNQFQIIMYIKFIYFLCFISDLFIFYQYQMMFVCLSFQLCYAYFYLYYV